MQWNQENIPIKITNTKTKKIIIILMKETIDIHPTITIINIINLCNNNTSQIITITTTTMIMTKDKRISYNNSYEDTKKYVHIQR